MTVTHEKLIVMLELQDQMNARVHSSWRDQHYPWYRAIWTEAAELMDHYGWKWWKKQVPDRDQVKLELIDIWHFGLSQRLQDGGAEQVALELAEQLASPVEVANFHDAIELFAASVLTQRTFDASIFASLMRGVGLEFDELYRSYVGKNILNLFRQENGYQEGHYRKIWGGREDNEHLVEILRGLDADGTTFRDRLYQSLAERYAIS